MSSRSSRLKRSRPPSEEDTICEVVTEASTAQQGGPCAAERKRELERNRRNLVNTRFAELENQLAKLPGAPKRVYRRIDKEVVLKDATQALASQQRDLDLANSRLQTMTSEVNTLRSEKLELRRDKSYLHNELASCRSLNKSLASDNMMLWQALCKCGAIKSVVPPEVSKIPVNLILGSGPTSSVGTSQVNCTDTDRSIEKDTLQSKTTADSFMQQLSSVGGPDIFQADLESSATGALPMAPDIVGSPGLATIDGDDFAKAVDGLNGAHTPTVSTTLLTQLALDATPNPALVSSDSSHPDIAPCG